MGKRSNLLEVEASKFPKSGGVLTGTLSIFGNLATKRSSKVERLPSRIVTVYLCLSLALVASICTSLINFAIDPGLGWHLATGKWIVSNFSLPTTDPFLFYHTLREWQVEQWLAEIILYGLYAIGGWSLLYAFFSASFLYFFAYHVFSKLYFLVNSKIACIISVLLAFKLAQTHFVLRPVLFSLFCFGIAYFIFLKESLKESKIASEASNRYKNGFLPLLIVSIFWANTHPSFPLLVILTATFSISELVRSYSAKHLRELLLLNVAVLFGTLVNPYGYKLYLHVYQVVTSNFINSFYEEWQSVSLLSAEGQYFAFACSVILLAFLISRNFRIKQNIFTLLTVFLLALWSIKSQRMLPYFAIASSYPLAQAICLLFSRIKLKALSEALNSIDSKEPSLGTAKVISITFSFLLFVSLLFAKQYLALGPNTDKYPYQAVDYMLSKASTKPIKVFNSMEYGGFLVWQSDTKIKSFIDDRSILLGEDFYKEYFEVLKDTGSMVSYARQYGADYILIKRDSKERDSFDKMGLEVKEFDSSILIRLNN